MRSPGNTRQRFSWSWGSETRGDPGLINRISIREYSDEKEYFRRYPVVSSIEVRLRVVGTGREIWRTLEIEGSRL